MSGERFLVTGAMGCIGAWVVRRLLDEGVPVVATDLANEPTRPLLLMSREEWETVTFARLDVTDRDAVSRLVGEQGITHIIHLAGLQIPFCRANPSLGAQVNVTGTVNLFEAARSHWGQVQGLAYASSLAVLGPAHLYPTRPVTDDAPRIPQTLYGIYKVANEETGRLYWQDWQIPSVGLRPYIVYGVGRDQGMTSDLAKAILAGVAGQPYHINFSGPVALQYTADVAEIFIRAARSGFQGGVACNLRNDVVTVDEFVAALRQILPAAQISVAGDSPLPFPADLDDSGMRRVIGDVPHTPLAQAIAESAARFEDLLKAGRLTVG